MQFVPQKFKSLHLKNLQHVNMFSFSFIQTVINLMHIAFEISELVKNAKPVKYMSIVLCISVTI